MSELSGFIKSFVSTERSKLKEMTAKEKADYIWEYYKIPIIAAIVILFIIGSIINSVWINPPKKQYLQIVFLNNYVDETYTNSLRDKLEQALMTPDERNTFQVLTTVVLFNTGEPQMDMANTQKFAAMTAIGEIDLLVINRDELGSLAEQGFLLPLTNVLPDNLLSKLSDKLMTAADEDGIESDYGISLNNNEVFTEFGLSAEGQCLTIIATTKRLDNTRRAIEFIFN